MNVVIDGTKTEERASYWRRSLQRCLDISGEKYTMQAMQTLVGVVLYVFVRTKLSPAIFDVRASSAGVGVLGVLGNKGSVSISFRIFDSNLCFVCAHLAHKRQNVDVRNQNYSAILAKTSLVQEAATIPALSPWQNNAHPKFSDAELGILDYESVFFVGDLNYHIDESVAAEEVFSAVSGGDLEALRGKDQLTRERLSLRSFQGFNEAPLNFAPTYKYQPGSDQYERRAEKKLRAPAWCDRVLWYTLNRQESIEALVYQRAELTLSDHKPVYAIFSVEVREVNQSKQRQVFSEVVVLMDKLENDSKPRVRLQNNFIDLGAISVGKLFHASLVVENTGTTTAGWSLVNSKNSTLVYSDWLLCVPSAGLLMPKQTLEIKLTAHVKMKHVLQEAQAGARVIEEILIMRIKGGGDFFCVVSCTVDAAEVLLEEGPPSSPPSPRGEV